MTPCEYVMQVLVQSGLPVHRLRYAGDQKTYITFQMLHSHDRVFADDEHIGCEYLYRADIFSDKNYMRIVSDVRRRLRAAGFYGVRLSAEFYEADIGAYHTALDFYYFE